MLQGFARSGGDSNPRYCLTQYDHLANGCFQPLSHRSVCAAEYSGTLSLRQPENDKMPKKSACAGLIGGLNTGSEEEITHIGVEFAAIAAVPKLVEGVVTRCG